MKPGVISTSPGIDTTAQEGLSPSARPRRESPPPVVSRPLLRAFTWYSRRYIRRHFHSLRVSKRGVPTERSGVPLVLYSNHSAWWDPLVALVLKARFFPTRTAFAPMDSEALGRYRMFSRMGFFGVDRDSRRGGAAFLRAAESILHNPRHMLIITPQGRFADPRERPAAFAQGLGHLAARARDVLFMPVAVEYVFWEERLPEILIRFGDPLHRGPRGDDSTDPGEWTARLERGLEATQDRLAEESLRRDPSEFHRELCGGAGQGGIYDLWRALAAWGRGDRFRREHGSK